MSKLDFIKKAQVAKEYSELDIVRMDYIEERPSNFEDATLVAQGVELTDIFESERVNRNNEPYISRFARLTFFDDEEEVKVSFPFNLWDAPKNGIVKIKVDNPLSNLIKTMAEDTVNNTFDVDYKELQKLIGEIDSIKIKPRVVHKSRSDFEIWGFDVVELKFKE